MSKSRLQQLLSLLEGSPSDSFINFAIAKEYEGIGEEVKALENFLKLKELDPGYIGTYYHLGKLYEKLKQNKEAYYTYQKGIEIARKAGDQHAMNELAEAKLQLGDEDDFD